MLRQGKLLTFIMRLSTGSLHTKLPTVASSSLVTTRGHGHLTTVRSSSTVPTRGHMDLFYDVLSPYSWVGFELMLRANKQWNLDLRLRPAFHFGIIQQSGNIQMRKVPSKFAHLATDLKRLGTYYHIPMKMPKSIREVLNKGTLPAQRCLTVLEMEYPEFLEEASRQLWMRLYNRDEDVFEVESIVEALVAAGCPAKICERVVGRMKDSEVKDKLKACTQEALDAGAFGLPTFVWHGDDGGKEMVWGSDRFHILAQMLGKEDPHPFLTLTKA